MGAVQSSEGVQLAWAVDPDAQACAHVSDWWQGIEPSHIHLSLTEIPKTPVDVIVLATPLSVREESFHDALSFSPRMIVCEKPFAADTVKAESLLNTARKKNVEVCVNFPRRFDVRHQSFRDALNERPNAVVFRYNKGLSNYASHFIDICLSWFGTPVSACATTPYQDGETDPSISFTLNYADGMTVHAIGIDGVDYDVFDIEFWLNARKLELRNGGADMTVTLPQDDLHYPGYRQLADAVPLFPPAPLGGMTELYGAIRAHLDEGRPFDGASGDDALWGLRIIDAIRTSSQTGLSHIQFSAPA